MGTFRAPSYANIFIEKKFKYPLRKKIHIPIYQNIFTYVPQVYRRYIFYMDRQ